VRERQLESAIHSTVRAIALVQAYPRTLIQLTLQITSSPPESESRSGSGGQAGAGSSSQYVSVRSFPFPFLLFFLLFLFSLISTPAHPPANTAR